MASAEAGNSRAGNCHPLLGSVVGDAVGPESLPMSYGFFVFRRR
ncbi:hypothetical protein AVEN_231608-1, partial [Araneus ventricosus]